MTKVTKIRVGGQSSPPDYQAEYEVEQKKAVVQLRSMGMKFKADRKGNLKLVVPDNIKKALRKVYEFSPDELTVGVDQPLGELARHIDEQASMEARVSVVTEFMRHYLNMLQNDYEIWFNGVWRGE